MKARLPQGMGGGPQNMNAMIRQAQKMQEEMEKRKDECRRTMGQRLEPKTGTGSKNNGMPGYHY